MPRFNNDDFEAEMDLSTLIEADRIKKDPARSAAAKLAAARKRDDAQKVLDKVGGNDPMVDGFKRLG